MSKTKGKFNATILNFKKQMRNNRNQVKSQSYFRSNNTYEDLLMSKQWKMRLVKNTENSKKLKNMSRSK